MGLVFVHDHILLQCNGEYYSANGNLAEQVLQRYIRVFGNIKLVTRGKDVDEVSNGLRPSSIAGTEFVRVPNFKSLSKIHNIFAAIKIIKREIANADYVIARTSALGRIAVRYARKYNKPYLVEVVGCALDASWNYSILGKIIAPFAYYNQKKVVKNAPYVVYVTNEYLQKKYPTKGNNINCSNVAINELQNNILNNRLEKIRKINKDSLLIIGTTAAVNVRYKGQQYVIEALGKLKRQGITNFEYHLVGGGDQRYLKSIAAKYDVVEQVRFLGVMPNNKVFDWLDTIDLYIQPSRQEGLPRALIEAMSRGLVAIGANTAGIPELLEKEYIFSNTSHNIDEICAILNSITPSTMLSQAERNFKESMKYEKEVIEERRQEFFGKFLNEYQKFKLNPE